MANIFGATPAWVTHSAKSGETVIRLPVAAVAWQSRLYLRHIHGRPHGARISVKRMADTLERMDPDVRFAQEAVYSWLVILDEAGVVHREPSNYRYDKWPRYTVASRNENRGADPVPG